MGEYSERPYVVCHMVSALDGKIDGDYFNMPEIKQIREASNRIREQLECDAVLYGAITMAEAYANGFIEGLPKSATHYPRTDYIAESDVDSFYIVIDIEGRLCWENKYIEKRGRKKSHIIQILTENVSDSYIAYLRTLDISYIFAGKDALDCRLLMTKLKEKAGIKRVMISGGGIVNWTFLQSGLIDELSLVICPLTDGSRTVATVFDQSPYLPKSVPIAFALENIQTLPGDGLWLKYRPKNVNKSSDPPC